MSHYDHLDVTDTRKNQHAKEKKGVLLTGSDGPLAALRGHGGQYPRTCNIRASRYSSVKKIIDQALAVREKAYCPYSKFAVGAALLCEDGTIIDGCNVENVSYGLTICAERAAICKAISRDQKLFKCIAICAQMEDYFVSPCGACRQVLAEFNTDMEVYLCKPNNAIVKTSIAKLLPLSFTPNWVTFST